MAVPSAQARLLTTSPASRYRSTRAWEGENVVLFRRDWPAVTVGRRKRHKVEEDPEFEVIR